MNKTLLTISWYIGLVAFIGGWIIFLTWAGGRYFGAWDFEELELIGFFWMFSFIWLALLGLLLLTIYIFKNRKKLHLKMFFCAIIILINIPSVILILPWQDDIGKKVFVQMKNESGVDFHEVKLSGNLKYWNIGQLNNGSSTVFNYDPPYWFNDARHYQKPDSLNLVISTKEKDIIIGFPTLRMGDCMKIIIDEEIKIKNP